jgi:hypothetical protein
MTLPTQFSGTWSVDPDDPAYDREESTVDRAEEFRAARLGTGADGVAPPRTGWWVWLILAAALAADAINFRQVVQLVMNTEPRQWILWTVVIAFSLLALWLAQSTGESAKKRLEEVKPVRSSGAFWFTLTIWLILGVFAFFVRYTETDDSFSVTIGDQSISGAATGSPLLNALMFLAIYLASGAAAGFAGFKRRHPAVSQFRRSRRARRRHARYLGAVRALLAETVATGQQMEKLESDFDQQKAAALEHDVDAAIVRLKQEAAMLTPNRPPMLGRRH